MIVSTFVAQFPDNSSVLVLGLALLFLKPLTRNLLRLNIFSHRGHNVVRCFSRYLSFYLTVQHLGLAQAGKVHRRGIIEFQSVCGLLHKRSERQVHLLALFVLGQATATCRSSKPIRSENQ